MKGRTRVDVDGGVAVEPIRLTGLPSAHPAVAGGESVAELHEKVRSLEPALPQTSPSFGAAVFILAAVHVGQNTERLAFFTGLPRPEVSRYARRLLDNGVWRAGKTDSLWRFPDRLDDSFWFDVAVALGTHCRRVSEDAAVEWAPAGYWNKWYHSTAGVDQGTLPNLYTDRPPTSGGAEGIWAVRDELDAESEPAGSVFGTLKEDDSSAENLRTAPPQRHEGLAAPASPAPHDRLGGADLFPEAAWLG
jgi:hypothetical protein